MCLNFFNTWRLSRCIYELMIKQRSWFFSLESIRDRFFLAKHNFYWRLDLNFHFCRNFRFGKPSLKLQIISLEIKFHFGLKRAWLVRICNLSFALRLIFWILKKTFFKLWYLSIFEKKKDRIWNWSERFLVLSILSR